MTAHLFKYYRDFRLVSLSQKLPCLSILRICQKPLSTHGAEQIQARQIPPFQAQRLMRHGQPPSGFGQRRRTSVSRTGAPTHRTLKTVYRNIRTQNGVLPFGAVLPGETPTTPVCMNPSKTFVSSAQPAAVPGCHIVRMRRPRSAAGRRLPAQGVSLAHCLHRARASDSRTLRCLWKCPAPLQSGHSSSRQRAFFRSASFLHVSSFFPPHWDGAKPLISFGKMRPCLNEKRRKKIT